MATSYSNPIPTGYTATTLDTLFATFTAAADAVWENQVMRYLPHDLQALLVEYLATVDEPITGPTKCVIATGTTITCTNSAGASVGPVTITVTAGVPVASFPATKAVLADGASVVVHDNGGGANAKSPGVAEVALGVVTDVKLAA